MKYNSSWMFSILFLKHVGHLANTIGHIATIGLIVAFSPLCTGRADNGKNTPTLHGQITTGGTTVHFTTLHFTTLHYTTGAV